MAGREQAQRRPQDQASEHFDLDDDASAPVAPAGAVQDTETDALLEEIDGVLETNAQDFVHSFVQKGGQ